MNKDERKTRPSVAQTKLSGFLLLVDDIIVPGYFFPRMRSVTIHSLKLYIHIISNNILN